MHHCASNASYTSQWWWVYCVAPMRVEICESNCSNFPWCHRRVLPLCLGTLLLRCSQKLWKAVVWVLQQSYLGQCRTRLVSPKAYDMQLNGHQVYFQGSEGSVRLGVLDHSCTLRVAVTVQLQVCVKLVVGQGVSLWWWSQKSCHPIVCHILWQFMSSELGTLTLLGCDWQFRFIVRDWMQLGVGHESHIHAWHPR